MGPRLYYVKLKFMIYSEGTTTFRMNKEEITESRESSPEYGECCFCGEPCNPCSQSCGRCAREITMESIGWKPPNLLTEIFNGKLPPLSLDDEVNEK